MQSRLIRAQQNAVAALGAAIWMVGLAALGVLANSARAQGLGGQDDVREGHRWAVTICTYCHVVSSDQANDTILRPPAPSFESIAQRKDFSADYLRTFLATTHRAVEAAKGMPNPQLLDSQIRQVAAYMLSLRRNP